jgi:cyclase
MSKLRIIPTILTDGMTVVKGKNFNNWRTVGNVQAIAMLYAKRDVDELMFLDVTARKNGNRISVELVKIFSNHLNIPFSVGGGINTIEEATEYFRNGAEKVVLGTSAVQNPDLIKAIASKFGSQAVIVSVDLQQKGSESIMQNSGTTVAEITATEFVEISISNGAGELLIQNVENDGEMKGYDTDTIASIRAITTLPIIASSGCGGAKHAIQAVEAGANAIAVGSLFQFTEETPKSLHRDLEMLGISLRRS